MKIFYESFLNIEAGDFIEKHNWEMAPYKVIAIESLPNNLYHVKIKHAARADRGSWSLYWTGDEIAANFSKISLDQVRSRRRGKSLKEYCWKKFDTNPFHYWAEKKEDK